MILAYPLTKPLTFGHETNKIKKAILNYCMSNFISRLLRKIYQSIWKIKESRPKWARLAFFAAAPKDPLFYLGAVSALFLLLSPFNFPSFPSFYTANNLFYSNPLFLSQVTAYKQESPEFLLVGRASLRASTPPGLITTQILGSLVADTGLASQRKEIVEYVVGQGDTLWSLSEKFKLSLNSILWANNLKQSSVIQPGQKLVIPPLDGVIYHIQAGDTVSALALEYKAKQEDILAFNDLPAAENIFVGDILIIPGGVIAGIAPQPAPVLTPLASSYFICPIAAPCRITQGLHWYNAVDFSRGQCGDPIFAAAQGRVLNVRLNNSTSLYLFGGAGNTITIQHPNGVVTNYGHLQSSLVSPGDEVSQGQIIAFMGGQPGTPGAGKSTGCHLHFGVAGAENPFAK
ncbi:MAG: LysM peptidoglycan-binding domain-containing protein [bacterium]